MLLFFHEKSQPQEKDKILQLLIHEYQSSSDAKALSALFLLLFRPALKKTFKDLMKKSSGLFLFETLDFWNQIRESFMEVLAQFDVSRPISNLTAKIIWRTQYKLTCWRMAQQKEENVKKSIYEHPPHEPPDKNMEDLLSSLATLNVITLKEKNLLHELFRHGKSLKEYAEENTPLTYENIRQMKSRAERKIKKFMIENPTFRNL